MNNKFIVIGVAIVVIIVIAAGGFYLLNANKYQPPTTSQENLSAPTSEPTPTTNASEASIGNEFTIEGSEFKFSPDEITVKKGEKVAITFMNKGSFPHDFTIEGLDVATKRINPGEEDTVEFTADQTGEFKFICSVATHEEQGMTGALTVVE